MASVSLASSPPAPVLDKNMTDSELAGDEREDGELEDGEIDDEGIGIEEENKEAAEVIDEKEKEKEREKERSKEREEKSHRHSRKRYKKSREKRHSKRRRRDRQKHHSPSSSSSSDSYNSDYDRPERPKNRKGPGSNREGDGPSSQHGRDAKAGHGKPSPHKTNDYEKYSDYSEDKYDYDEEEEDYEDDMSEYGPSKESSFQGQGRGRRGKEHMKRGNMRTMKQQHQQQHQQQQQQQQQHQFGHRGRGRGGGPGRGGGGGRGMLMKGKKLKGKPWVGRGRGRGGELGMEDMAPEGKMPGFQKKRPIMSKEFINQHTVEHNGRYICKYFLEGRCIKGMQCKFEHEHVVPDKKKELCKFYLQGYCSKGDNCIYMHNEYPCKFFHTGAKCYQGDNCKFSHDALNDVTKELLEKIINTEEENAREEELELEDLRKQGIAPLPKPPPGVGLLPTPGQSSPTDGSSCQGGKKIPSLFEIKVQPTVNLAHKIAQGGQEEGEAEQFTEEDGTSGSSATAPGSAAPMGAPTAPPVPQNTAGQHPQHAFPMQAPGPPSQTVPFLGNHPNINPQMNMPPPPPFPPGPELQMLQNLLPFSAMGQNPVEFLSNLLRSQTMGQQGDPSFGFMQNLQQPTSAESQLQSLPPAVQEAIFLHLAQQQKQQQQQESHPAENEQQSAESQDDNFTRDETTNWYSSDEEEGGVSSILRSLKKQSEMQQAQSKAAPPLGDPRLLKDRAPPTDPRVKADPRQRPQETKKEAEGVADPRIPRDPRKVRPVEPSSYRQPSLAGPPPKAQAGEEEDEGERELRDKAVLIPLEAGPGALLRDPRCQLQQFSHIRVDILLQRPAFAQAVVWAPEDLIPSLVPKQEHAINLPLPPLIADAQLNRSSLPDHSAAPQPSDPRLAAARLKERMSRLSSGSLEGRPPAVTAADRPADPRQQKALDPRLKRTGSLDAKSPPGQREEPRLPRVSPGPALQHAARAKAEPEKLPPYAPRLAASGGGLESPTTILGGISLYDPRSQSEAAPREQAEPPRKTGILKHADKRGATPPPLSPTRRSSSLEDAKSSELGTDPPQAPASPVDASPAKPPAVHNLPIQALAGLIRPQYSDSRQAKPGGQGCAGAQEETEERKEEEKEGKKEKEKEEATEEEEEEGEEGEEESKKEVEESEDDDRTLKDVFKTFDPTASPFCQ